MDSTAEGESNDTMASTRATEALTKAAIPFETATYAYEKVAGEIGLQAALSLGVEPALMLKTLMIETPTGGPMGGGVLALVPSDRQLDLKAMAKAAGVKKCALMAKPLAEKTSGYVIGGISPLGQKRALPTFIDASVEGANHVWCNGGQRGLQIKITPADLARATRGTFAAIT
ncbi:MAG: Cys-tRNA(Pro) deacylase [Rhodospirillales bacterium]